MYATRNPDYETYTRTYDYLLVFTMHMYSSNGFKDSALKMSPKEYSENIFFQISAYVV